MSHSNPHHAGRVSRPLFWISLLSVFIYLGWIQFFKDEQVRALPPVGASPPFSMGQVGSDYFLDSAAEWLLKKLYPGTKSGHTSGLPDDITKCAPEHAKLLLDEAPRMRTLVSLVASSDPVTEPYWRVSGENAAAVRAVLFAKAQGLAMGKQFSEALEWLEPCKRLEIRRAHACRTLEELAAVAVAARRVDDRVFAIAEQTSLASDVAEAVRILAEPVASRELFLKVLDKEFRERWSEFAGEEDNPWRKTVKDFLGSSPPHPFYLVPLARSRFKPRATCNLLLLRKDLLSSFALLPESRFRGMATDALHRADAEQTLGLWSIEPNRAGRIFTARVLRDWLLWEEAITERENYRRDTAAALRAGLP